MLHNYNNIFLVDFEYRAGQGEQVEPRCMVALDYKTKKLIRMREEDLKVQSDAPFPIGDDTLFVSYYASAEISCFLRLGWKVPPNILDLYTEFRVCNNGRPSICGKGLLGALAHFGINGIASGEKNHLRQLSIKEGPLTAQESNQLLEYCESDVRALEKLLPRMEENIDWPRALLRGRYMAAVARMEHLGIPIDADLLFVLRREWEGIKKGLVQDIDQAFGVYDGLTFKSDRFRGYLERNGISWPRTPKGVLALDDDTFKEVAKTHSSIEPLRQLRNSLSKLRLNNLAVGRDGRNRCLLSPFGSKTGRNQPSNVKYIFGPAVWYRGLIKPKEGMGVAYIDWSQQEFGIGAALSRDQVMMDAYSSGDPYLAFAKQAGVIPADATKHSHPNEREQFKACTLAVQYGMGAESLAVRIGQSKWQASNLLELHRKTYQKFWKWSDAAVLDAMAHSQIHTTLGWPLFVTADASQRSLRNFPMQANGAEMLRIACIFATEAGISVCGPIHDALLIEASLEELPQKIAETQQAMEEASAYVLGGFRLRSDVKIVTYPDRYEDPRGKEMWGKVMKHLGLPRPKLCRWPVPRGWGVSDLVQREKL